MEAKRAKNLTGNAWLFCLCASVYLLVKSNNLLAIDGTCRFQLTENLVERGSFTPACRFLPAQSILQAPLYLAGKAFGNLMAREMQIPAREFFVGCFNSLIAPFAALLLFRIALRLRFRERVALGLALIFSFTTAVFHYARFNSNEPLLTVLLLSPFYFILCLREERGWRNLVLLGVALAFLIIDNYGMFPVALVTTALILFRNRDFKLSRPQCAVLLLMVATAVAFSSYYNHVCYGSPWMTGYQGQGRSTPGWDGLYGLLLSPGKSFFLYNPVLLLSLFWMGRFLRRNRDFWLRYFMIYVPLYFLALYSCLAGLHSCWIGWSGGWVWGPRYLVPILPFLILPLGVALERYGSIGIWGKALFTTVVAASFIVQLVSIVVHYQYYWITIENWRTAPFYWRYFSLTEGPFVGQFRVLREALSSHPEYFDFCWAKQFSRYPVAVSLSVGGLIIVLTLSIIGLRKSFSAAGDKAVTY